MLIRLELSLVDQLNGCLADKKCVTFLHLETHCRICKISADLALFRRPAVRSRRVRLAIYNRIYQIGVPLMVKPISEQPESGKHLKLPANQKAAVNRHTHKLSSDYQLDEYVESVRAVSGHATELHQPGRIRLNPAEFTGISIILMNFSKSTQHFVHRIAIE